MHTDFSFASLPSFDEIEKSPQKAEPSSSFLPEKFMVDDAQIDRDYLYMKQMHSSKMQLILDQIEDICDRMEYEGSFLYDEAPDKTTILKIADEAAGLLPGDSSVSIKDLIFALLCNEILFRRRRYQRKKKMFS